MSTEDLEKEIMRIKLTDIKKIEEVFEVGYAAATNIRRGKTDPQNSKMVKASKVLGWSAEAHAQIYKDFQEIID